MKIEKLIKMEGIFILLVISTVLFFTGKAIIGPRITGMITYDYGEMDVMYQKIQAGMSFDEIREIFGEPDEVENIEEAGIPVEYWHYAQGANTLRIGFKDGKVDSKVVT